MPDITPANATAWVQFGGTMIQIGIGAWQNLRAAFKEAGTPEEVLAEIDERHADYLRRIADAQARAGQ